jgi:hypothetical protein
MPIIKRVAKSPRPKFEMNFEKVRLRKEKD